MDPFDHAKRGDVEYFRTAPLADIQTARDNQGDSVLSMAVKCDNLECCQEIYRRCPSLLYHESDMHQRTAMQHAAWSGAHTIVEFLISADNQKDYVGEETDIESSRREEMRKMNVLTMVDDYHEIALHKAVDQQKPRTVKLLVEADPSRDTLKMVNSIKDTALHIAVANQNLEIVTLLIEADPGRDTLKMVNSRKDTALHIAVTNQNLEIVALLIQADRGRDTLKMVNLTNDTALHIAVANQNLEIVTLLVEADPEFQYGVNLSGHTPLEMAMEKARSNGNKAANSSGKIRKLLLEKQISRLKEQADNGWTLLHFAASIGDLGAIQEIIQLCPDCMELVDDEGRNFLHLAVKHVQVVKHILGTKQIPPTLLNMQDIGGNTPLHTAALSGDQESTKSLLYDRRVKKTTTNNQGQAVLDAINFDYDEAKAEVFGISDRMSQNQWKNQSDFDLVVGALIGAVSFTAGLTVPGGYISDGPNRGMAVLAKRIPFVVFVISNNFALMFSLYAVFSHFCTRRLRKKEDISYQLKVAQYCTLGAIFAMVVAFFAGSYAVLSNSKPLALTGCISCCFWLIFAYIPVQKMFRQRRRHPR